ncbi:integumentary mucin A.1-like isoform X2 [Caloenas nicobarica]|uniref:integumentary mucin A.1-like isoform X2 n=1 Tax=Caloenas nicobarica TaxID=187106 RepID=UPI0032B79547
MAGQRRGLPLLLSLAVMHLLLGTTDMDVTVTMSPTHPTSLTPVETSALLPTAESSTAGAVPPSSPPTGSSTPESSSTSLGTSSISPPTTPALTAASSEPLTALADTTATPNTITSVPRSTPAPCQLMGTTAETTLDISTLTTGLTSGTLTAPGTPNAVTGMEPSSPGTSSAPTPEVTLSTTGDLPTTLPVCPTTMSNTSASRLFLSLRLTVSLDLGNTTVQELVLSKLRRDLQTVFPCAGVAVEWRGTRRT